MPDDKKDNAAPLVDTRVLAELRALLGDDVDDLIDTYLAYAPTLLAKMTTSCSSGDTTQLARHAHALKGSAGNLGVLALSGMCAELEQAVRDGTLAELPGRVARLNELYVETAAILRQQRGRPL